MGDVDVKQYALDPPTERLMYGYTKEQWLDPARLVAKAQKEWDEYHAKSDAFDLVKNKDHWKGPIDAIIDHTDWMIVEEAISFFAGGRAKFSAVAGEPSKLRVVAPGYWVCIG